MKNSKATEINKSLTSLAYERLRTDVLMGNFRPTERLRIQNLSEKYQIGATAMREALSRLVSDGLVDFEDQRGFSVAAVSKDDLIDLTQTRIQIEGIAANQAVERGDIDWESNVLSHYHRLSKLTYPDTPDLHFAWAATHRSFHLALISGCGSSWLIRLCGLLYDKSERYRNLAVRAMQGNTRDTVNEHKQLVDAALARDGHALSSILAEHFSKTTSVILERDFADSQTSPAPEHTSVVLNKNRRVHRPPHPSITLT